MKEVKNRKLMSTWVTAVLGILFILLGLGLLADGWGRARPEGKKEMRGVENRP